LNESGITAFHSIHLACRVYSVQNVPGVAIAQLLHQELRSTLINTVKLGQLNENWKNFWWDGYDRRWYVVHCVYLLLLLLLLLLLTSCLWNTS